METSHIKTELSSIFSKIDEEISGEPVKPTVSLSKNGINENESSDVISLIAFSIALLIKPRYSIVGLSDCHE